MAQKYPGISRNFRPVIEKSLNGHNAKVFSGIEYVFIATFDKEWSKADFINRYKKAVYGKGDRFLVNKLAFNNWENSESGLTADETKTGFETGALRRTEDCLFDNDTHVWMIPIDPKKSKFNCKTQGEFKGKTYASELTTYVRGAGRISVEFFNNIVDREIAVVFKDSNGNYRVLFDPVFPVESDVEQDSGEGLAADAGFTVTFKNESKFPPLWVYGVFDISASYKESYTDEGNLSSHFEALGTVYTAPSPKAIDKNSEFFIVEGKFDGEGGV